MIASQYHAAILERLGDHLEPSDDDLLAIAQDVLRQGGEVSLGGLRALVASHRSLRYQQDLRRAQEFVMLLAPLPKDARPTVVASNAQEDVVKLPQRQPYRVRLIDLEAFATAHGLHRDALERVGRGEQEEHRGWTQGPRTGNVYEVGQPWANVVAQRQRAQDAERPGEKPTTKRRVRVQTGPQTRPTVTYAPADRPEPPVERPPQRQRRWVSVGSLDD